MEVLIESAKGEFEEVDLAESAVTLCSETQFRSHSPVIVAGLPRHIIHAAPDKLWLEDISGILPGNVARQESATGDLPSLFWAFGTEWDKWWHRNADNGSRKSFFHY